VVRHTHAKGTRDEFYTPVMAEGAGAWASLGAHVGVQADDDDEGATFESFIPHDFSKLATLAIALIPLATLWPTNMTMTVQVDHCKTFSTDL
jgi:hypothetical protein